MRSSMSTWMRAEATLKPVVLLGELTPQPNLILRIPVAVSLQLTSTQLDAMSFVLLQPQDPPCLLTEAAQHLLGRKTELETIFHLGHPLRTQARHCHGGRVHPHSATPGLPLPSCRMTFPPCQIQSRKMCPAFYALNTLSITRRVGLQSQGIVSHLPSQHSRL